MRVHKTQNTILHLLYKDQTDKENNERPKLFQNACKIITKQTMEQLVQKFQETSHKEF